jgi:hypothetical protein
LSVREFILELPANVAEAAPQQLADALWLASLRLFAPHESKTAPTRDVAPAAPPPESSPIEDGQDVRESDAVADGTDKPREDRDVPKRAPPQSTPSATQAQRFADLHAAQLADARATNRSGIAARVPAARALPAGRAIARALRPLRRSVKSRVQQVLDEEATAEGIAECSIWFPTLRPARNRWLDLALVIDESSSMTLWRDALRELRSLLAQVGAFRDIRVWWLDTSMPERAVIRAQPRATALVAERRAGELLGPDNTRVVLIASDCIGAAWDSGAVTALIELWGRRQPVAILQLLPPGLWRRTALDPAREVQNGCVGASMSGSANHQLVWRPWRAASTMAFSEEDEKGPDELAPVTSVAVPVLTAEPDSLARWAGLIRSGGPAVVPAIKLPLRPSGAAPLLLDPGQREMSPKELLSVVKSASSPMAFRLVRLLAAAPLRLPIMRLVQQTLLPESHQVHLAEVFLSGLIRVTSDANATDPDLVPYDFVTGVRELLLDSSVASDAVDVQRAVSRYVEGRFGHALDFDALLESPEEFDEATIKSSDTSFAKVSAEVLRRLGGRYARIAAHLTGMPPEPEESQRPDQAFAGSQVLWISLGRAEPELGLEQLRSLGARVNRVTSYEEARPGSASYDAVVCECSPEVDPLEGIEFIDQMQTAAPLAVFVLLCREPARVSRQAADRHVCACVSSFAEAQASLAEALRSRRAGQSRAPSHLPDRCEADLGAVMKLLRMAERTSREETNDQGDLSTQAMQAWRVRWDQLRARTGTTARLQHAALQVLLKSSGAGRVRIWNNVDRLRASSDVTRNLTAEETRSLGSAIQAGARFSLTDIRREMPQSKKSLPTRAWLFIPVATGLAQPSTRAVVSMRSSLPFAFGPRHIEWLSMLVTSLGPALESRAKSDEQRELARIDHELSERGPRARQAVLLRTALRLEGMARTQSTARSTPVRRLGRRILELAELTLRAPQGLPIIENAARALIERAESLIDSSADRDKDPLAMTSLRFSMALLSPNSSTGSPDALPSFAAALRGIPRRTRRIISQLTRLDMDDASLTTRSRVDAFRALWPSGSVRHLPFARRPSTFVSIAGPDANQRDLLGLAELIGSSLAAAGFGLVTVCWPGVEEAATRGFVQRLEMWDVDPEDWLVQIRSGDRRATEPLVKVIECATVNEAVRQRFERARASILIGGKRGTEIVGRLALGTGTLLLPIAQTGGAAAALFRETLDRERWAREQTRTGVDARLPPRSVQTVCGAEPLGLAIILGETLRNHVRRGAPRGSSGEASDPLRNLVGVYLPGVSAPVAGFALANPKVVITWAPRDRKPQNTATVVGPGGLRYDVSGIIRVPEIVGGDILILRMPYHWNAPGLRCRPVGVSGTRDLSITVLEQGALGQYTGIKLGTPYMVLDPQTHESARFFPLREVDPVPPVGAAVMDSLGRVHGILAILADALPGTALAERLGMLPAADWYRRVQVAFAAKQLEAPKPPVEVIAPPKSSARKKKAGKKKKRAAKKSKSIAKKAVKRRAKRKMVRKKR